MERSQDLAQFAPYQRLLSGGSVKPAPSFRSTASVRGRWLWGILWVALLGFDSIPLAAQQVPVRELQDPRVQEAPVRSVQPNAPPALDAAQEAAKKKTIH